ncbi:MAG: sialidase family protein [Candidatus Eremiobacter antarcticus]
MSDSVDKSVFAAALVASTFSMFVAPQPTRSAPISVGQNVMVSNPGSGKAYYEVLLSADPSNATHLLACTTVANRDLADSPYDSAVYVSSDSGAHWTQTLYVRDAGDPACAVGVEGRAYFAAIETKLNSHNKRFSMTRFYRSTDAGEHWLPPVDLSRSLDREFIAVDKTSGKQRGFVYVNAAKYVRNLNDDWASITNSINTFGFFVSSDGGKSFERSGVLAPNDYQYVFADGGSTVLSNGTYIAVFPDLNNRKKQLPPDHTEPDTTLKLLASEDAGETFNKAVIISPQASCSQGSTFSMLPQVATDYSGGPFKDRLYVVWPDQGSGRCEIKFSYSKDKGKTWSSPATVNDDVARPSPKTGPDDFMPAIAVNKNGVVGVLWQSRQSDSTNLGYSLRFAASFDGGESFEPSVAVSTASAAIGRGKMLELWGASSGGGNREDYTRGQPLAVELGYDGRFDYIGGDTIGLAADGDGVFHGLWTDNRAGIFAVWTAPMRTIGIAVNHGSPDLASLSDVTEKATIDVANVRFNKSTSDLTADFYLANTSKVSLEAPLKLRITSLRSKLGAASLVTSATDYAQSQILDFTPQIAGALAAGKRSQAQCVTFHIANLHSVVMYPWNSLTQFISLQARVYAKAQQKRAKAQPTKRGSP